MDLFAYIVVAVLVAAGIAFALFLGWISSREAREREEHIREITGSGRGEHDEERGNGAGRRAA